MSTPDYNLLRQLSAREGSGYWQSLAELAQPAAGETHEQGGAGALPPGISRRNLLKLLGASVAMAGLAGCSRQPAEHIVPYVNMPEHLVPGQPEYYATSFTLGGYAQGLLAESVEGRPVKLEGNPQHPATLGACDAISQASVLALYDPDRSAAVRHEGVVSTFPAWLTDLHQRRRTWDANQGAGLCFLTANITSPSAGQQMQAMRERWPLARWFVHEPIGREAVFAASRALFGRALEPRYQFDQAAVVVSLDADFMQSQPGFLRYARDLTARRRPSAQQAPQCRLYALESVFSVTGGASDHRYPLAWQQVEAAARQLAMALDVAVAPPAQKVLADDVVQAMAQDLRSVAGGAVVVPGDQQSTAVHLIAQAINHQLGAVGNTLDWIEPVAVPAQAEGLAQLVEAIHAQEVDSLLVLDSNPIQTAPADLNFAAAYQRVAWRAHWGEYCDETANLSHWHLPATHFLETWGDAAAYDGSQSLVQPLILPLHGGKTLLQVLAAISQGQELDARQLLIRYWRGAYAGADFERFWQQSLHDGVIRDSRPAAVAVTVRADWQGELLPAIEAQPGELELRLMPDAAIWDGRFANNAWLQEMPRPLTTLTWHNAALISPALAERLALADGQRVSLSSNGRNLEVPVFILPGQPHNTIGLALGHGRTQAGGVAEGSGSDAYALQSCKTPWAAAVSLQPTERHSQLAATQAHHAMEGRDLVRASTWQHYQQEPDFAQRQEQLISLYQEPSPQVHNAAPRAADAEQAWGMSIDLSACIGCNACVTACQAENNIPVVGAEEVARGHDMHWIRVDRYFAGPLDNPTTVFQPVPCMHCENAPCEYVCPVGATQHSSDGLNQMVYQRCVGTRYCSQNCPYKVRRFNWFEYTAADAPYPAHPAVQNPDVTVRSRGVMEKCTYCVQRISRARQDADAQGRPLHDGEPQTACQQACPTRAIVFGDVADPQSKVSQLKAHPLNYAMLAHLNTRPRTTYLAGLKNPHPQLASDKAATSKGRNGGEGA
ncbi:MAG: 4Fe-4S dicluster domain-containing protein [Halopseudomonas sp.]|uniref:4Fe-4S dicluster domain-containing protein n=1 Tax=Halopseudomonas sp. TaxID=2901191 RepID=UPI0030023A3F